MKVSGAKAAEHRSALISTARRLLQEQGFEGAGVAEISREAGLTQGALYSQFKSKDALAAAATRQAFADGLAAWDRIRETAPDRLRAYMDAYLSPEHSQDVGGGCLLAACLSDVRRQNRQSAMRSARASPNSLRWSRDRYRRKSRPRRLAGER